MFENGVSNSQILMMSGANVVGLVSLLAYTVKSLNEVNSNLEDIRLEVDGLKSSFSENNKRSNLVFNRLHEKIQQNMKVVDTDKNMLESIKRKVTEEPSMIYEKKESNKDDVEFAIAELMG
jgi:hypothetical protein